MELELKEHFVTCPYCWERISFLIDYSAGSHRYVEDCEVCCRPIVVACDAHGSGDVVVSAEREA